MTIFPSGGQQELARYHDFNPSGVPVSGQQLSLVESKEHFLERSIDPSGALDVWNSPARLSEGQFAVVTDPSPGIHEVYVNLANGYCMFNVSETWTAAYLDYTSLGSVPSASGFNLVNETLESVQTVMLNGAPSGQTRFDVIESYNVDVSGQLDAHMATDIDDAHPGTLSVSKLPSGVVYASGLPTTELGVADPSGQTTLSDHFTNHPEPYWEGLIRASGNAQTIGTYVDAQLSSLEGELAGSIAGVSGLLQADIDANWSNINDHVNDNTNPHGVTKTQLGLGNVENTAISTWGGSSNLTTIGPQNNITISGVLDNGLGTDISVQQARDAFDISVSASTIITGGSVVWASGLTFDVTPAEYYVQGVRYSYAGGQITLGAADPTYARLDVIYLNVSGVAGSIEGTPSANPIRPDVDPDDQLALTFILVDAGATEPVEINQTDIYKENVEWTVSTTDNFITNSPNNPYAGSVSIHASGVAKNDYIDFSTTSMDLSVVDFISLYINPNGWNSNLYITLEWYNNGASISNVLTIDDGDYAFDETNASYQQVVVPLSNFGLTSNTADALRLKIAGKNGTTSFYVDNILLQEGASSASPPQPVWKTIEGDTGSATAASKDDILTVAGASGIYASVAGKTLTIGQHNLAYAAEVAANTALVWSASGNLQNQIDNIDFGPIESNLDAVSGVLQAQITSNDGDISALQAASGILSDLMGSNIADISTNAAAIVDLWLASGVLQGQVDTLQSEITSNDADIVALQSASGQLSTSITALEGTSHTQNTDTGTTQQDWHINTANPDDEMLLRAQNGWLLIGQANPLAYGNLRCNHLEVQGTLSYQNQDILQVEDPWIELNVPLSGVVTDPSYAGVRVNRDAKPDAVLVWDESTDAWSAGVSGSTDRLILASGSVADLADHNHSSLVFDDGTNPHGTTLEDLAAAPSGMLQSHLDDFNNPHNITQELLDVAPSGWVQTHISDTNNPHSVTKSQLGLANVENTALSTWVGSTAITTLGTITTGTWQGAVIPSGYLDSNIAYANQDMAITGNWSATGDWTFSDTYMQIIQTNWDEINLELGRSTGNSLRIYPFQSSPSRSYWRIWNGSSETDCLTIYSTADGTYAVGDFQFKQNVWIDGILNAAADMNMFPATYTSSVDGIRFNHPSAAADGLIQPFNYGSDMTVYVHANAYIDTAATFQRYDATKPSASIGVRSDGIIKFMTNSAAAPTTRGEVLADGTFSWGGGYGSTGFEISQAGNVSMNGNLTIDGTIIGDQWLTAAPSAPTSGVPALLTENGGQVEVRFNQSSTSNISRYEVWQAVGADSGYALIAMINPGEFASPMTVIDTTYTRKTTIYYRVYAVKNGRYSAPLTGNIVLADDVDEATNMNVVAIGDNYYIGWDKPDDRRLDHIEVKCHAHVTELSLSEGSASLIYSGNRDSFFYEVPGADVAKYHQFWVYAITRT